MAARKHKQPTFDPSSATEVRYAYRTSGAADELRKPEGCFYVNIGTMISSPGFDTLEQCEKYLVGRGWKCKPHKFTADVPGF